MIDLLLIEQDAKLLQNINKAFEKFDNSIKVRHSSSLADALRSIKKNLPDIILTEYMLPDGKGAELIFSEDKKIRLPVAIILEADEYDLGCKLIDRGALTFIVKDHTFTEHFPVIILNEYNRWLTIKKQKEAVKSLLISLNSYREMIEEIPLSICKCEPDGKINFSNITFCNLLKLDKSEVKNYNFFDFVSEDDAENIKNCLTSLSVQNSTNTTEAKMFNKKGKLGWFKWRFKAKYNADGDVLFYQCYGEDISDHVEAINLKYELAAIVESSDDAVLGIDFDGKVKNWNNAATRIFGYEMDDIIGKDVKLLVPGKFHKFMDRIFQHLLRGKILEHFEVEGIRKDNHRIDLYLTVSTIKDNNGKLTGFSAIIRNITEQKIIKNRLYSINKLMHTLSKCHKNMLNTRTETDMLYNICQTLVEEQDFTFAWIGKISYEYETPIQLIAEWGNDKGFMTILENFWSMDNFKRSPALLAIEENRSITLQNIFYTCKSYPWYYEAIKRGIASIAVVPIIFSESEKWILAIYSDQKYTFNDEEKELLEDFALSVVYGVNSKRE